MTCPHVEAAPEPARTMLGRSLAYMLRLARILRHRREVARLEEWDDGALRDIGLSRADVRLALAAPLSVDPSAQLMLWTRERRSARLLMRREGAEWAAAQEPAGERGPPARIASIAWR